jgi:4-hydroxybenzoate polyprenyltransferase
VDQLIFNLLKTARPRQWLKNLSIAAALIFSGQLFNPESILLTFWAILIFSLLTSSVYFINDIVDINKDRLHPFKKFRPIAAGKLSIPIALFFAISGSIISLYLSFNLSFFFFLTCLVYFILQIIYSFYLKNLVVFDVMSIAASFILRVYAGAIVLNYHVSIWFLLCVTSLALFMAVGKRRAELSILDEQSAGDHRKTLSKYPKDLLDNYLSMFASSAWLSWALFTFFESTPVTLESSTLHNILPLTISGTNKWLMMTIPLVIYGIMRYQNIAYQESKAESAERVLLSDKSLLTAVILWGILVVWIIYGVGN